jgi:RsiW-degrading membrane proteinase PrsW (M82 family)
MPWTAHRHAFRLALALGALALGVMLAELGPWAFGVGVAVAVVPVPVYVLLALWLDRYEPEPPRMLATTFLWGASVAVGVALVANSAADAAARLVIGDAAGLATAVLWAPVVEEVAKGAALLVVFAQARDEFDNVTDGVVYAAMVGLGFAMTENVLYYGRAVTDGPEASLAAFLLRGVAAPFAHPLFSAMLGIGLGIARERSTAGTPVLLPLAGLAAAVLLHAAWNLAAGLGDVFPAVYLLVMVPVFLGTLAVVRGSLRREARVIREQLAPFRDDGTLSDEELDALCTLGGRTAALLRAARRGGVAGWRRRTAFHRTATELAFHRWRLSRDGRGAVHVEEVHVVRLRELRE